MIKIKDLLREIDDVLNNKLASLENEKEWNLFDIEFLENMGFEKISDYAFLLENPPLKIYKMRKGTFVIDEPIENHDEDNSNEPNPPMKPSGDSAFKNSKQVNSYQFPTFEKVKEFFDNYKQDL